MVCEVDSVDEVGGNDVLDVQGLRREHPSGVLALCCNSQMPFVLDVVLDLSPITTRTGPQLARMAGVSLEEFEECLGVLLEVGVVEEAPGTVDRYRVVPDSGVGEKLRELNQVLNEVFGSGE